MFDSVLIANRGEIAVRVIATLRRMGIRSVALFSDADEGARHVREADLAIHLGPTPASESYLNVERILDVASTCGAQAVHPGYGFLAENARFARECARRGLVFIGPSPDAIELMGDKIQAKLTVARAGVPVVPGRLVAGMSDQDLETAALEVGYPVLVKPSAGGGGKGMRLVIAPDDLAQALAGARREALASFGDDTLFIERYVQRPRHVEVQVLCDAHGNSVQLGERECSLQRRHQKVIEESPSPLIQPSTRQRLGDAAIATARSVDYTGVGTVEFIVSSDQPNEFFFMEMNTRLQVEHRVTEMVTGLDLVEQQLLIASGEVLDESVTAATFAGHAVEARIYAESSRRGFLPTSGRVLKVREPLADGLRVDSALVEGLSVGTDYDPLLAKVIAWGVDRPTAFGHLHDALCETVIHGVETNVDFLATLVDHEDVLAGRLDTDLINRSIATLIRRRPTASALAAYGLSWIERLRPRNAAFDPWDVASGWRLAGPSRPLAFVLTFDEEASISLSILEVHDGAVLRVEDEPPREVSWRASGDQLALRVDGVEHRATFTIDGRTTWVSVEGETWPFIEESVVRVNSAGVTGGDEVRSPMPGTVVAVRALNGEVVRSGQALVIVSAMKMEHVLVAPRDGSVDILVREGDSVVVNEVVARLLEGPPVDEVIGAGTRDVDDRRLDTEER